MSKTAPTKRSAKEKKDLIVRQLDLGLGVMEALRVLGVSKQSYDYYRRSDPDFQARVYSITRGSRVESGGFKEVPDFPEFCEQYLGMKLWPHQLQWYDLLEGREPRDIHPSMSFSQGDPDMLIVNTPPGHAKSQTITVAYTTWRVVKDPAVKIVLASKTQKLATQFLLTIKNFLTHPNYKKLQEDFGPPGGYSQDSASWKQDLIYVASSLRDTNEKDPTIQAIGIGGQLYGARADLIILDDTVDNANAKDFERQIHWIATEVQSRLPDGGKILIVGTRMAPQDLYGELRNPSRYADDEDDLPWTYFSQPAVLEYHDDPEKWVTLWPVTDRPSGKTQSKRSDGFYDKWTGPILAKRRKRMPPSSWARVYQQEQVAEDTVFNPEAISASVQGYSPGIIPDSTDFRNPGLGRVGGMNGLYIIAGLDPAAVGHTAAVALAVDPASGLRYVLDVHNQPAMKPEELKALIFRWQDHYAIREWRIERNAFQGFLTQDQGVRDYIAARGGVLVEHTTTGQNKHDPLFGVMAMGALFDNQLIKLPRAQNEGIRALIEQLSYWTAELPKTAKTDCVMALWFAELRAQELVRHIERKQAFMKSSDMFHARFATDARSIIPTGELEYNVSPTRSIWG